MENTFPWYANPVLYIIFIILQLDVLYYGINTAYIPLLDVEVFKEVHVFDPEIEMTERDVKIELVTMRLHSSLSVLD